MSEDHFGTNICNLLSKFMADERGVSPIEYGLLAVGILVAIVAVAAALGTGLDAASADASSRPK
jgi:Flp pilus assembly pilin Flp